MNSPNLSVKYKVVKFIALKKFLLLGLLQHYAALVGQFMFRH